MVHTGTFVVYFGPGGRGGAATKRATKLLTGTDNAFILRPDQLYSEYHGCGERRGPWPYIFQKIDGGYRFVGTTRNLRDELAYGRGTQRLTPPTRVTPDTTVGSRGPGPSTPREPRSARRRRPRRRRHPLFEAAIASIYMPGRGGSNRLAHDGLPDDYTECTRGDSRECSPFRDTFTEVESVRKVEERRRKQGEVDDLMDLMKMWVRVGEGRR
jgi:hypothetical protein